MLLSRITARAAAAAAAVAMLLTGAAACGSGPEVDPDEIVLGLVEDTAGPGAAFSKITSASVRAAVKDINADGGVLGKRLRIAASNDSSDPSRSPTVTRRVIGQKGAVAVLFTTGSGAIIADKTVTQQAEVVGIAPTSAAAELAAPPDNEYFYIQVPSTEMQAKAFIGAFRAAGIEKLAIFTDDTATIAAYNKVMIEAFRKAGIRIVAKEQAAVGANDVTAQVSRIRDARPDAVLATTVGGQVEVLFHNTAASLLQGLPRFSLASIGNQPKTWKLANPGALDGLIYTSHLTDDNPRTERLRRRLAQRRGPDFVMTDYDADAYNAVHLIKRAIELAGGATPEKIHEGMNKLRGQPAYFGQKDYTISFGPDKHLGADGPCGLVFRVFDGNRPGAPWDEYQPEC